MALINTCLKRTFTTFNVLFATLGAAIIIFTIVVHIMAINYAGDLSGAQVFGFITLYVLGSIIMMIAIVGAYGAHEESKASLIVFLVCMVVGTVLMFYLAVSSAIARPQLVDTIEDYFRNSLPLNTATEDVKSTVENLQTEMHCCGLFSSDDWNKEIPDSCNCNMEAEEQGECKNISYKLSMISTRSIYRRPCFPILMHYVRQLSDSTMYILFTQASLALLGMILSSVMIHQIRYTGSPAAMLTVPAVFSTPQPNYQALHNPPPPY